MSDGPRNLDRRTFTQLTLGAGAAALCGCLEQPKAQSDAATKDAAATDAADPAGDAHPADGQQRVPPDGALPPDGAARADTTSPVDGGAACVAVWQTIPAQTWQVGVPVSFDLAAYLNASQLQSVAYAIEGGLPPGLSLTGGVISGTPAGEFIGQVVATADPSC